MSSRSFIPPLPLLFRVVLLVAGLSPILRAQTGYPDDLATVGQAPAWVVPIAPPPPSADAALYSAGSEYLLVDDQTHPASATFYARRVIHFISIQGVEDRSTLTWTLDPDYESLVLHRLDLIRDGERIPLHDAVRFRFSSSSQDDDRNSYDNQVEARILIPDARVGDILDYAYTIRGANPITDNRYANSFQLSWTTPVARLHYRILHPDTAPPIRWRLYNEAEEPVINKLPGNTEYVWSRRNTPVDRWEDNMPEDVYIQDWVELSTWDSWEAVSQWGAALYPLDTGTPPDLLPILAEWKRKPALEDRIVAAIRYVQDEYRYVSMVFGPHGYQPFPPDQIVRHRYGDCKDKSLLLCILLRDLGVPAVPVLVDVEDRATVSDRLPSPSAFDHVIVRLWVDGRAYDVDPTVTLQGGTLRTLTTTRFGVGLPLIPEGSPLAQDVGIRYHPGSVAMTETFRFEDWAGGAELVVETVYTGEEADAMRRHLARRAIADLGEGYREYYATTYGQLSLLEPVSFTDDRDANRLVVTESYAINDLFEPDPGIGDHQETRYFESTFIIDSIPNPSRGTERQQPFALNPRNLRQSIVIHIPDESEFEPEETRIENPHASLLYTVRQEGRILRIDADYRVRRTRIEPFQDFRKALEDFDAMRDTLSFGIIADVGTPPPSSLSPTTDPTPVEDSGGSGILSTDPRIHWVGVALTVTFLITVHLAFRPLRRAPATDSLRPRDTRAPTGIGGWMILVVFGFAVGLVLRSIQMGEFRIFYDAAQWYALTEPSSNAFVDQIEGLIIFELLGNLFFLYLNILVLIGIIHKRWYLPRIAILALLGYAVFDSLDTALYLQLEIADPAEAETYVRTSIKAWVSGIIWSLYFHRSRRVHNTFRTSATLKKMAPPRPAE